MFFRKSKQPPARKLGDIVQSAHRSGYVFDEINGDLGAAADEILKESKDIIMAYGYARRAAATALYLQGYFKKEDLDYVQSIFKSLQARTGHSVEFQEQAFADSISFMQSYHHVITAKFVKELARIAREYAQETARRSGISPHEYIGALQHSQPEVDGPNGPQQLIMALSFQLADDQALMVRFRCDVGRAIQEHFNLGNCSGKID